MKRFFSLAILLMAAFGSAMAQDVQVHYDLGHSLYKDLSSRMSVTTTVEMFKPDTWGSTFMFTPISTINAMVLSALIGRFLVSLISQRTSSGQPM